MRDFFSNLYELIKPLYGADLADHLYGYSGNNEFQAASLYVTVGILLFSVTLVMVVAFYYFRSSPRFGRWYHWLIVLIINAALQWFLAFYLPYKDKRDGLIHEDLVNAINDTHLAGFGFLNLIYSLVLFFLFSLILKRWSTHCSTTPF